MTYQSEQDMSSDLEDFDIDVVGLDPANSTSVGNLDVLEFNFVDASNILCGICSQIVPYETLFNEHMVNNHPEFADYSPEDSLEDVAPHKESKDVVAKVKPKVPRNMSKIRITKDLTLAETEFLFRKKIAEKMGREVPFSLVDKKHARCGICEAVLYLGNGRGFIRHCSSWHTPVHECSGEWIRLSTLSFSTIDMEARPLSNQDFAVIDLALDGENNLQCIWCGALMNINTIAMHFQTIHQGEFEVPNCDLCLQELVINSRFTEKFGFDLEITLAAENQFKCEHFGLVTRTESVMDAAVTRKLKSSTA